MSNQFPYPGDNSIIIQDGSIVWNNQSHDQSSLQYMDANDSISNDSTISEGYVTAIDSNETQYYSILEHSNDITLEGLHNLTIGNTDVQENIVVTTGFPPAVDEETAQENEDEDEGTQVVVFTIDGSDDLYGIQFSQDEEGNIQKYQFKFRTAADGQLEAIPESIQLLPNDDQATGEAEKEQAETAQTEEVNSTQAQKYYLVQTEVDSEVVNNEIYNKQDNVDKSQEVGTPPEHTFIKGECQSPIVFEESIETENCEEPQQQCLDLVQPEDDIEAGIQNINIKTEIIENTVQIGNISNVTNVKQQRLLDNIICRQDGEQDDSQEDDLPEQAETVHVYIKQQAEEPVSDDADTDRYEHELDINEQDETLVENTNEVNQEEELIETDDNRPNQEELVQQFMSENCQIEVEFEAESEEHKRISQEYQLKQIYNLQENQKEYYMKEPSLTANNDSDNEQYEIVEGLHVSGEINEDSQAQLLPTDTEPVHHEVVERYQEQTVERTNILKHPIDNTDKERKVKKPLVSVKYYVVYPEKENVNSLVGNTTAHIPVPKMTKPNPRSVLRTSFIKPKDPVKVGTKEFPECDLFHKRFAKNKEAMRAKLFHNFLNRTTIPHAPVRQSRQPRKQEIKPVTERRDEEIIVQEVMVSSNGFIESLNQKKNKKLQVTAVVELSDSEEESALKTNRHRRKTHQIPRQISESELSVIEIHSDEETDIPCGFDLGAIHREKGQPKKSNIASQTSPKRRRGRPPKKSKLTDFELSPSKRNCTKSEEFKTTERTSVSHNIEINNEKKEIACPKCTKTFPSQNSLNTHIIHHNLENSLKNKAKMNSQTSLIPRQSLLPKIEYNHKCENCQETFKNSILLKRHICAQKSASLNCSVCLKEFRDITMLNIHKKSHNKSNLITNTTVAKISPRKTLYRPAVSLMQSPGMKATKKLGINSFKCKQCSKICDSEQSLIVHTKMHKKFLCSSCLKPFSSKILLDTHVRTNCVKIRSPLNKRLSFKIRKSFVHTPPRQSIGKPAEHKINSTINSTMNNTNNMTLNQSVASFKLDCDICKMKFSTYRNLYTHKVQKHGLSTPDKSLMAKPKKGVYKPRAAHGGIPANDKMKRAYAALRQKLAEMQEASNV